METHMTQLLALILSFRSDDEGQGLAEYALILALIAIVAIIALIFLGDPGQRHSQHRRQVRLAGPSPDVRTAGRRHAADPAGAPSTSESDLAVVLSFPVTPSADAEESLRKGGTETS